jgi:hypothetical protein
MTAELTLTVDTYLQLPDSIRGPLDTWLHQTGLIDKHVTVITLHDATIPVMGEPLPGEINVTRRDARLLDGSLAAVVSSDNSNPIPVITETLAADTPWPPLDAFRWQPPPKLDPVIAADLAADYGIPADQLEVQILTADQLVWGEPRDTRLGDTP